MEWLLIGGKFDDEGGEHSGYMDKLHEYLELLLDDEISFHNGGNFDLLETLIKYFVSSHDVILWFPEVPNDKPKLVKEIKKKNHKCLLVSSKFNNGDYSFLDIISRALQSKSNLILEFTKASTRYYAVSVIDPLGNIFLKKEILINEVAISLVKRINELSKFTRVRSESVGPYEESPVDEEFFKLSSKYANVFHELIHGVNPSRFLGNLSFRCAKGFPSFRGDENRIYVSRRNIDKRDINKSGFVPISLSDSKGFVGYLGENKPSVDAPIQVKLYKYYPKINYMIHSHLFIDGIKMTKRIIPCGAIEEFYEIVALNPDCNINSFYLNLKGHGSLVGARDLKDLENLKYIRRKDGGF